MVRRWSDRRQRRIYIDEISHYALDQTMWRNETVGNRSRNGHAQRGGIDLAQSTWNPTQDPRAGIARTNRGTTPLNITPTRTPCAGPIARGTSENTSGSYLDRMFYNQESIHRLN